MCLDPDVSRVSAEGLKAVVAATEHFLQRLAVQAAEAATAAKRSTIKFSGWCSAAQAGSHCPYAHMCAVGTIAGEADLLMPAMVQWQLAVQRDARNVIASHALHACVLHTL